MKTDSNHEIDKRFDVAIMHINETTQEKILELEQQFDLSHLDLNERVVWLDQEENRNCQEMKCFKGQDYLAYVSEGDPLRTIFRDNCIFFHDHEVDKMQQAIFLIEKSKWIARLKKETYALFPVFSIDNYHRSDNNAVFFLLNQQPAGTTNEDYIQMISCQIKYQFECVFSLCLKLRERFKQGIKEEEHLLLEAKKELKLLRKLLDPNSRLELKEFILLLKKLKAIHGFVFPADEAGMYQAFLTCLDNPHKPSSLRPKDFKQCLKEIKTGTLPGCSLLGLALLKYEGWLNDLAYEMITVNDHPEFTYDRLFDRIRKESIEQGKLLVDKFKEEFPLSVMTREEYEQAIHNQLTKIKTKAVQLQVADYYHYIDDMERIKCCFINNCMESKDAGSHHAEQLKNALVFDTEIRFLEHELIVIGKGIKAAVEDILRINSDFSMVIAHMVPNQQIVIKVKMAFEKAMQANWERKPLIYVLEDLEADLNIIFEEAEDNLLQLFEDHSYNENMTYALRMLQEINIMEFKAKTRGLNYHEFYNRLKKILNMQIRYLSAISTIRLLPIDPGDRNETINEPILVSFKFKGRESWLLSVLIKANKRYGILDPRTSMDCLLRVLMSEDLTKEEEIVYISCRTNIFKYIIHFLKPFFENLTYANVGRSELFISHLGHTFTEACLKGSILKDQKKVREIASYFI